MRVASGRTAEGVAGLDPAPVDEPPAAVRTRSWQAAWARDPEFAALLVAGALAAAFGGYTEAYLIAGIFAVTTLTWYQQHTRAGRIANLVRARASVVRDDGTHRIPVEELARGDVVRLAAGDRVPADVRITEAYLLEVDESAGGARPAGRGNIVRRGATVSHGVAQAAVTTSPDAPRPAEFGLDTSLGRKLNALCHRVSGAALAIAVLVLVLSTVRGEPVTDVVIAAVALTIGATPRGLPGAASVVLTGGAVRMVRDHAIPRNLSAVESLGGTTVVCADKTGTFTENRMTVTTISAGGRTIDVRALPDLADPALRECALAGLLCNESELSAVDGGWAVSGDPTETALIPVAELAGLDPHATRARLARVDLLPFESERRLMVSVHHLGYAKGAVEEILARCEHELTSDGGLRPVDTDSALRRHRVFADDGLRVLAFARFETGGESLTGEVDRGGWTLLGLQAMRDPVRPEAAEAVAACCRRGIAVKMITGDHPDTAASVARTVGLDADPVVLTGAELDLLDDDRLDALVLETTVFARIAPGQKLRLVRALHRLGETVAMTGDGLSDVPALRGADTGIALGERATDAARDAADLVLCYDAFASIVAAIGDGRSALHKLRGFLLWSLPSCLGAASFVLATMVAGVALKIAPLVLLSVNLTATVALGLTLRTRSPVPWPRPGAGPRDRLR